MTKPRPHLSTFTQAQLDRQNSQYEGSKRAVEQPRKKVSIFKVIGWLVMIGLATMAVCFFMSAPGCVSLPRMSAPKPATAGAATTYTTLKDMSWAFIVPGILTLIGSYWIAPMRKLSGPLLVAGACAAVLPWALDKVAEPVLWCVLAIGGTFAVYWLGLKARKMWLKRNNGHCEPVDGARWQADAHAGAI